MSKVISFSISDRYLDQIRSLYPGMTDNLAVKQFLTDRLDSSLDVSLYDGLDGRVRSLVESELDGLLDERLDATVGKMIGSLNERLARLEARLDGSLDGSLDESLDESLDDGEPLLEREREASIASIDGTVEPAFNQGMTPAATANYLKTKKIAVSYDSLRRWADKGKISHTPQGRATKKHFTLQDGLYYPIER